VKTTPADGPYVSNPFSWTAGTTASRTEVVTAADDAGNTASAATLTLTNDSTAPTTTDNTASIGTTCTNTTQTVTLAPTDAASGVATTYYTTNGSTPTTSSSQGTSIVLSAEGIYTIKYFTVDNVGNSEAVKTGASTICIDQTAPAPTNIALANGGGGAGTVAAGDTLTITYSEVIDAATFCSTWTNGATRTISSSSVIIQIADTGSNDTLTVSAVGAGNCGGTGNFQLGSIALGGNYVTGTRAFGGATASQISWTPGTRRLTITLGTPAGGTSNGGVAAATPVYTPSSSLKDIAGNTINTSAFSAPATSRF